MKTMKKILLVDAQTEPRQLLAVRLEILGVEVMEAGTVEELSSLLSLHDPDLVIADWSFPGLGGLKLLEKVQSRKRPVILFTETVPEDSALLMERTGARAWVSPKKRSNLLERVQVWMDETDGAAPDTFSAAGRHILLIEDSDTVRHFLRRVLSQTLTDCVIREAADGRAAISEMSHKKVDLIVTDLEMPGMDGRTFLRKIRANPLLKKKPIMVLSGGITAELKDEFKSDTQLSFVEKPSTSEEISETAIRLLA